MLRFVAVLIVLVCLAGCHQVKNPSPPMAYCSDDAKPTAASADTDFEGCINRWKSMVVVRGTEWKSVEPSARRSDIARAYSGTAAQINQFIEAYASELSKDDPRFGNLEQVGRDTEERVKRFVELADQGNEAAAIEWVTLLPIIKEAATLIFDKYREMAKENKAEADLKKAADIERLKARALQTDMEML